MQRTDITGKAKMAGRRVGSSTTLNRKYVKRPVKSIAAPKVTDVSMVVPEVVTTDSVAPEAVERSAKIKRFNDSSSMMKASSMPASMSSAVSSTMASAAPAANPIMTTEDMVAQMHPLQEVANSRMKARKNTVKKEKKMTAKELKDKAIKEALATASAPEKPISAKKKKEKNAKIHFGFGRVVLALSCAAVAVFAIVYFVNLNMPDVSLKVAAMQTGINAAYPTYVPRDYALASITSENKRIVLEFKNSAEDSAFTLVEETSSWDSNALLSNYVKDTYGENYQTIKEQGLTIYISGSNAAWVNGGIVYKITAKNGTLTNKQIKAIATSL